MDYWKSELLLPKSASKEWKNLVVDTNIIDRTKSYVCSNSIERKNWFRNWIYDDYDFKKEEHTRSNFLSLWTTDGY